MTRFSQKSLDFITKATRQKKKEWLDKNRNEYEDVLVAPMRELMEGAALALRPSAPGYRFPTRGHARIKRGAEGAAMHGPFRDWIGVSVSRDSESRYESLPNLYFQFAEGHEEILSAGGLYVPSADQTKHIRKWIDQDASLLEALLEDKVFKKRFKELGDERVLKTKPRDYPLDHPKIDWLKLSAWYVWRPFTKKEFFSKNFSEMLIEDWAQVLRLNQVLDRWTQSWPKAQGIETLPEIRRVEHDF
jgi:uncharacterized protein (TIGR02453 family)